uniref:Saposin B-type domain-containing protein n=1 Tax=Dracunculus medinensis TaxID=318479 RepID=A0A0N4U706_DRAME
LNDKLSLLLFKFEKCDFQVAYSCPLPQEKFCENCMHVLKTIYGHFSRRIPSKRALRHQITRQFYLFQYRRRCLTIIKPNYEIAFVHMTKDPFVVLLAGETLSVN